MTKPKVLVFSKTRWSEPPRLTHQIVRLLKNMDYEVILFEKPSFRFWFSICELEGVTMIRHFELVHHRLRFFKLLTSINASIIKYFIRRTLKKLNIDQPQAINFNYDYYFLRELLRSNIITIIGDDFINKLNDGLVKTQTKRQLRLTAENSTKNLAVSYPLKNQLEQFVEKAELFFPWSEEAYESPQINKKRDVALFFGYVNYRIDWSLVFDLTKMGVKFRFIGPIEKSVNSKGFKNICKSDKAEFLKPRDINEIDFSDVCCSILPWDTTFEGIQAITINNKCFNLLSKGLPQIYPDLPYLIEADPRVIAKCRNADEFVERINYFSNNFAACQQPIIDFLENNYSENRAMQLEKYLAHE